MNLSSYVGLPFAELGRGPDAYDCWALLALVYRECFGLALPSYDDRYDTTADGAELAGIIAGEIGPWREIAPGAERTGDGVLMTLGGHARHVGIVAGDGLVLHTERGTGSIIQSYHSARLARRVRGFFRHESLS